MRRNDFEIEFDLIQTTPLIHFNAKRLEGKELINNKNETFLRATELKPKFDKFLRAYCRSNSINIEDLQQYLSNAFDYSVEIKVGNVDIREIGKNPLFWGNLSIERDIKKFKEKNSDERFKKEILLLQQKLRREVYLKDIKVSFFSFKKEMIDLIEKTFESFLASTNFGTRASKGFGSFYIKGKKFDKEKVFYVDNEKLKKAKVFYFSTYPLVKNFNYKNWQDYLNLFYKFLRSGINLKDRNGKTLFYSKPFIFEYFKNSFQWEKRAIKSKCLKNELEKQLKKYPNSDVLTNNKEKRIIKDVFGLSIVESWRSYKKTLKKESVEKIKDKPKYKRFRSPITFKFVDGTIYFWANETFREILGKEFIVSLGNCKEKLKIVENFDFNKFFEEFFKLNLDNFIEKKYHKRDEFKILKDIHNQIRNQQ